MKYFFLNICLIGAFIFLLISVNKTEALGIQGGGGPDMRPAIEKLRKDMNDGLKKEIVRWDEKLNEEREARRETTLLTYWALGIAVLGIGISLGQAIRKK